jgi:hypothetical protein
MHDDESLIGNQNVANESLQIFAGVGRHLSARLRLDSVILCLIGFLVFRFGNNGG